MSETPQDKALLMLAEYQAQCERMNLSVGEAAGFAFAAALLLIEQNAGPDKALKWAYVMADTAREVLNENVH